jgi:hypothetical protein
MGRVTPWKVALVALLVATTVGFGRMERQRPAPVAVASEGEAALVKASDRSDHLESDPISAFLIDLVSGADEAAERPPPLPLISELPPLPEAYWPSPVS